MDLNSSAPGSSSHVAAPKAWELVAQNYAVDIRPLFEPFALRALGLAEVRAGHRIVDVATGPGTLEVLAARAGASVEALDFAAPMIAILRQRALEEGLDVHATEGDGMALPYDDASFDAGFSMFGLMFFPDRAAGFKELARVLRPGARLVVSSWQPLDEIPFFATLFTELAKLLHAPSGRRELALTTPEECSSEMGAGGFYDITVEEQTLTRSVASTEDLFQFLVRSSAPLALAKENLGERWPQIAAALLASLAKRFGEGEQTYTMTANITVGRR